MKVKEMKIGVGGGPVIGRGKAQGEEIRWEIENWGMKCLGCVRLGEVWDGERWRDGRGVG